MQSSGGRASLWDADACAVHLNTKVVSAEDGRSRNWS